MKKMLIISTLSLLGLITLPIAVGAISNNAQQNRQVIENRREEIKELVTQKRETISNRLEENKLKACQNREGAINNIMARISDRGTKQLAVFTKISDRVKAFYVDKNLSVTDYDNLVNDVDSTNLLALDAITNTKGAVVDFKCDGNDPKGFANVFKNYAELQRLALKDHKTAVNNLIVAVKSAQGSVDNQTIEGDE
jgi:hypothetical protein